MWEAENSAKMGAWGPKHAFWQVEGGVTELIWQGEGRAKALHVVMRKRRRKRESAG